MPRSIELEELKGLQLGGVYVFTVSGFAKRHFKIGMSEDDIYNRLMSYTTSYPKNYWLHGLILYPNTWHKYLHTRDAESTLHRMFKDKGVYGYPNQKRTEWFSLPPKEQKQLWAKMEEIAQKTGGSFAHFEKTHEITLPSA